MTDINLSHAAAFTLVGILLSVLVLGFHRSPKASPELGASVMNKTSSKSYVQTPKEVKDSELESYLKTSKY